VADTPPKTQRREARHTGGGVGLKGRGNIKNEQRAMPPLLKNTGTCINAINPRRERKINTQQKYTEITVRATNVRGKIFEEKKLPQSKYSTKLLGVGR